MQLVNASFSSKQQFLDALNTQTIPNLLTLPQGCSPLETPNTRLSLCVAFPEVPDDGVWLWARSHNEETVLLEGMQDERINFLVNIALGQKQEHHQRKFKRVPLHANIQFSFLEDTAHTGVGQSQDIGFGGLSLRTENALPVGTNVELTVDVTPTPVRCQGKVVWRRDDSSATGAGIEFNELKGLDLSALRELIHRSAITATI